MNDKRQSSSVSFHAICQVKTILKFEFRWKKGKTKTCLVTTVALVSGSHLRSRMPTISGYQSLHDTSNSFMIYRLCLISNRRAVRNIYFVSGDACLRFCSRRLFLFENQECQTQSNDEVHFARLCDENKSEFWSLTQLRTAARATNLYLLKYSFSLIPNYGDFSQFNLAIYLSSLFKKRW